VGIDLGALLRSAGTGLASYQTGKREAQQAQQEALAKLFAQRLQERQQQETERRNRALEQIQMQRPQRPTTVLTDQGLLQLDEETGEWGQVTLPGGIVPKKPETERPVRQPVFVPPQAPGEGGHFVYPIEREGETPRVEPAPIRKPQAPERAVPASIARAITTNRKQVSVIQDALKQLARYPEGMGLKNVVPDLFMQRIDPQGVPVRASVADIGSLQIHERSGAAVTVSEAPRLKPFIPLPTDTPEAAKTKLNRLLRLIEEETRQLEGGSAQEDMPEVPTPGTASPAAAPQPTGYRPTNPWARP